MLTSKGTTAFRLLRQKTGQRAVGAQEKGAKSS